MEQTLDIGDRILVNRIGPRPPPVRRRRLRPRRDLGRAAPAPRDNPARRRRSAGSGTSPASVPSNTAYTVKRVIGLPGRPRQLLLGRRPAHRQRRAHHRALRLRGPALHRGGPGLHDLAPLDPGASPGSTCPTGDAPRPRRPPLGVGGLRRLVPGGGDGARPLCPVRPGRPGRRDGRLPVLAARRIGGSARRADRVAALTDRAVRCAAPAANSPCRAARGWSCWRDAAPRPRWDRLPRPRRRPARPGPRPRRDVCRPRRLRPGRRRRRLVRADRDDPRSRARRRRARRRGTASSRSPASPAMSGGRPRRSPDGRPTRSSSPRAACMPTIATSGPTSRRPLLAPLDGRTSSADMSHYGEAKVACERHIRARLR